MQTNDSQVSPGPRPPYLPPEMAWETLPAEVRLAIDDVVTPIYQCYVVENGDVLQRSTGMSLVYLVMYEALEQIASGRTIFAEFDTDQDGWFERQRRIGQILRLIGAKQKCTDLLIRLQSFREKLLFQRLTAPVGEN
jgi:hypothetical protein